MELRFHCKYVYNRIMIPLNTHLQKKKRYLRGVREGEEERKGWEKKRHKRKKRVGCQEEGGEGGWGNSNGRQNRLLPSR